MNLKYRGFSGTIEWSYEDEIYHGKVQDVGEDIILYDGKDLKELKVNFEEAVDDYLELVVELGRE